MVLVLLVLYKNMEFRIETWSINKLIEEYNSKKLELNPEYQRRFIWSLKDQRTLINSIFSGYAIPNIFLYDTERKLEVVDGQQRIRTILGYYLGIFSSLENKFFKEIPISKQEHFMSYLFPVTIIESIKDNESIEEFYSLVNSAGIHLNRPELKKAEYFETNFLKLINELSDYSKFKELALFTQTTTKRMNDVDFVSELVTLMILGITDKKKSVDKLFEKDITDEEYEKLKLKFKEVIAYFSAFNNFHPIKQTRYKQRNDFYTLFEFILFSKKYGSDFLNKVYESLVLFNNDIVPSNEKCEPFQEYAFNCISQSNSKNAREVRKSILTKLFINKKLKPNKVQKKVISFLNFDIENSLEEINGLYIIDTELLKKRSKMV